MITQTYNSREMLHLDDGTIICPACKDHVQEHTGRNDCKNTFYRMLPNGKLDVFAQCCCYSKEHE